MRDAVADVTATTSGTLPPAVQRFVRETVERWHRDHMVKRAVWTERGPVVADGDAVLVPVDAAWIVAEPVLDRRADSYRTSARAGVTRRLSAIVVDTIPATAPELGPPGTPASFAAFLGAARAFDTVIAMSDAVATEWQGLVAMLGALGVEGPEVIARPLPGDPRQLPVHDQQPADPEPVVLVTGGPGPVGNHPMVLAVVERLWRSGLKFVVLVDADELDPPAAALLAELVAAGRPAESYRPAVPGAVPTAYQQAWVMVRPSLAGSLELAVVDSLVAGTPVLTSDRGALGDLAAGGGVVTVDPADGDALEAALRHLLVAHRRPRSPRRRSARSRTFPTWTSTPPRPGSSSPALARPGRRRPRRRKR